MTFTTAGKELESKTRREERAKSPGPTNYRPKSEVYLKRSPSCTIGHTKRSLCSPSRDKQKMPGPCDYQIDRSITHGPKYHIANRFLKLLASHRQPGPSDYIYDPNVRLKRNTRVTIGGAKRVSCLIPREKSPGPFCYNPNKLNLQRRHPTIIFSRAQRIGVGVQNPKHDYPGPGSYFQAKWVKN
jgi:hypothetical protein